MTELKTLKELSFWGSIPRSDDWKEDGFYVPKERKNEEWITKEDLRQEAIKWVNEWVKQVEYAETGKEEQLLKSKCLAFRDFFNLTEEDLK